MRKTHCGALKVVGVALLIACCLQRSLNARVNFTNFVSSVGDGGDSLGVSVVGGVGIYVKRYHADDAAEGLRWCARLASCSACRGPTQPRCKPPVTLPPCPLPSLRAMSNRKKNSHSSEAWELPPPAVGGEGSNDKNGAAGAYLGLFRPPGNADAEMGFHMCVAVIPSGEEARSGDMVTEEVLGVPGSPRLTRAHPGKEVCLSTGRRPPFFSWTRK